METGNTEFCFVYVSFEKPVRHSKGLVWESDYNSLEFKEEIGVEKKKR